MDTFLVVMATLFLGVVTLVSVINAEAINKHWNLAMGAYADLAYFFQEIWWTSIRPEIRALMGKKNPVWEPPTALGYYFGDIVKLDDSDKWYMVLSSGVWMISVSSPLLVHECDDTLKVVQAKGWKYVYNNEKVVEHVPADAVEAFLDRMIEEKIYG